MPKLCLSLTLSFPLFGKRATLGSNSMVCSGTGSLGFRRNRGRGKSLRGTHLMAFLNEALFCGHAPEARQNFPADHRDA